MLSHSGEQLRHDEQLRAADGARNVGLLRIKDLVGHVGTLDRSGFRRACSGGLSDALARLDRGAADVLMAIRLDRVSRSVADFAGLLARAKRRGWRIVLLSPNLDTEDPAGKFTAHVLAAAAECERDLIGARTREGMAQRRAEGVHVGPPRTLAPDVLERIAARRAAGASLRAIADELTDDHVPTAHGGARWHASTVRAVLRSLDTTHEVPAAQSAPSVPPEEGTTHVQA